MNLAVRRFFQGTPVLRDLYRVARRAYNRHRLFKAANSYFFNPGQYQMAFDTEDGKIVDLQTKDGLTITVRQNYMDAAILGEIFFENCYGKGLRLPNQPIVVDIGGYIGDFALWAVKRLNACKVVVYEPSLRNWALLKKNIANNHYETRIEAVNKAVTDGEDVMMNIDAPDRRQAQVSAYGPSALAQKRVPGIALASLVESHGLKEVIDLLKIDCEGGEYIILLTTPTEVFKSIRNIVFECHEIDGFETKLKAVRQKLSNEGFSLKTRGSLIYASRA